eukprot:TRINITY_DN17351_c0_g1_i1.p1 TRINITY_DN17351_c0_g1~~TRINITY_DN17351_c0_g1_i1.p1  ORF type:complete len:609 (-),score=115.76 TRINITY_DN17351_c0_g1_i1:330-2156(-)
MADAVKEPDDAPADKEDDPDEEEEEDDEPEEPVETAAPPALGEKATSYKVEIDHSEFPAGTAPGSLGLNLDRATFVVKTLDPTGKIAAWNQKLGQDVEPGDLLISANGRTVLNDGKEHVLKLLSASPQEVEILELEFVRRKERKKQEAALRILGGIADEDHHVSPDGLVILDEGEPAEGVSDVRYPGTVIELDDGKGYGRIKASEIGDKVSLTRTIGFTDVAAPIYLIDNGKLAVGDLVMFNVYMTQDGKPRAQKIAKAKHPRRPPPKIDMTTPLPQYVSWTTELQKGDAVLHRPAHPRPDAASGGKRPALARLGSAEIGHELADLRGGSSALPKPQADDELSNPDSEESADSLSGGIARPWDASKKERRYLYSRDRALEFSESWRPIAWTHQQWEQELKATGELGHAPSSHELAAKRRAEMAQRAERDQTAFMQGSRRDMLDAQRELESTRHLLSPRLANLPREEDPEAAGFSPRAQFARDDQTEEVGKVLLRKLPPAEVSDVFQSGLMSIPTLQPLVVPELRSAELFKSRELLHQLFEDLHASEGDHASPGGSRRAKAAAAGPYRGIALQVNGPLYAAQANFRSLGSPVHSKPDPDTAARHGRKWL